jgi:hypothetical protein
MRGLSGSEAKARREGDCVGDKGEEGSRSCGRHRNVPGTGRRLMMRKRCAGGRTVGEDMVVVVVVMLLCCVPL